MESGAKIVYEFSRFQLDLQQRLLISRADGSPIPLSPKVFDTLLYLVERRGELLNKTTLLKAIWPNIVVEENSLNQNISALRRALGESPGEHRFIVTEPGRGYRFVADVRTLTVPAATPSRPGAAASSEQARATAPVATPTARNSIAVLPFANMTGDPAKEYFSDGMAEELIHTLARIPGLKVPSRTSSFSYKGRNVDVRQIARDLEVGAVLEGSVRSAGERIRVTAQLIDAQSGYHLWSQNYDRQFEDLFKLQDELATAIVQALQLKLDETAPSFIHEPPTRNLEAYQLYLQAIAMQVTAGPNLLPRAVAKLQRAIHLDPRFARAYNALAALHAVALVVLDEPLPSTLADAEREAQRALTLDPNMGGVHAALGTMQAAQGKWRNAEERFRESLALDENDPTTHLFYGLYVAGSAGYLRRYLETSLVACRLAPVAVVNLMTLSVAYMLNGREAQAEEYFRLGMDLGMSPHIPPLPDMRSTMAVRAGRYKEAADYIIESLLPPNRTPEAETAIRRVFSALANPAERPLAIRTLDEVRKGFGAGINQFFRRRLMVWYSSLGAVDQAYDVADDALAAFARKGTIGTAWTFIWMPEMRPFREDPRFQQFCARLNFFEYWNLRGPPDNHELHDGKLICY
jgi:TolB-like protein